jgi:hypothetical protein
MPKGYVFKSRVFRPTAWLLPPPREVFTKQRRGGVALERPAWEAYGQFWDDLFARNPETFGPRGELIHQMAGTAFSIQDPVEAECVKFTDHGSNPRQRSVHVPKLTANQLARASEWQLLLQIDSDIEVGMEWGDVGRLYVCARKEDLAARRFDRCWTVMQCY